MRESLDRCHYLCISAAEPLNPLHIIMIIDATATKRRKRVRVRVCHITLLGGNRALADFQVTPPFGSSMLKQSLSEAERGGAQPSASANSVLALHQSLGDVDYEIFRRRNGCPDGRGIFWAGGNE